MVQKHVELVKKVCLLGDPGVGKTSLVRRFVLDQFDDHYLTTIGAKVTKKTKVMDVLEHDLRVHLNLMIWDVAGHKEYRQFHEMYLRGMEGVMSVADLTRASTFEGLKSSMTMVQQNSPAVPVVFLLNKCDLADPSSKDLQDIMSLAGARKIPVLPTSAKTGQNVEKAFDSLAQMMVGDWVRKKFGGP